MRASSPTNRTLSSELGVGGTAGVDFLSACRRARAPQTPRGVGLLKMHLYSHGGVREDQGGRLDQDGLPMIEPAHKNVVPRAEAGLRAFGAQRNGPGTRQGVAGLGLKRNTNARRS